MNILTKESQLLATHWDAVEDVRAAEQKLREDLSTFLKSLKQYLLKMDWWTNEWNFIETDPSQVYIAHSNWRKGKEYALWIGVERFVPEVLFGKESVPQLYLWARDNKSLAGELREMIEGKKLMLPSEFGKGQYILRMFIPKCLPQNIDQFEDCVKEPILTFFSQCAAQEAVLSAVVLQSSKK